MEGGADGTAQVREAVATLAESGASLEHARACVELGAALRRSGERERCRAPLRRGLDLAYHYGATGLAELARADLRAAGARVRRPALAGIEALTPSERHVADLVAQGMTNREAAQALFVTEKTVEAHLGSAYRKLGIHSRAQLAHRLHAPNEPEAPPPEITR